MSNEKKVVSDKELYLTPETIILINKHLTQKIILWLSIFTLVGGLGLFSFIEIIKNNVTNNVTTSLNNIKDDLINDINKTKNELTNDLNKTRDKLSENIFEKTILLGGEINKTEKKLGEAEAIVTKLSKQASEAEADIAQAKIFAESAADSAKKVAEFILNEDPKFKQEIIKALNKQQNDWIEPKLLNNWVTYNPPYNEFAFFKSNDGIVYLRGMIKNGKLQAPVFNLPEGFRPKNRELQIGHSSDHKIARIDVLKNGNILIMKGGTGWVSLDGIRFDAVD